MLNEQTIDRLAERLTNRIEELNVRILKQIGSDIAKIGTLTPTDAQKLGNILKYGGSYEKIAKEIAKITGLNIQDVYQIFEEVSKIDQTFAKTFYEYRNVDFIPYDQNIALKRQTESLARLTASEFANFSNANILGYGLQDEFGNVTYKGIRETYNQLIDEAILSISQGKETFNEVMYKQIKQMGSGGLRIIYPSTYIGKDSKGNPVVKHHTRRLDSVVRSSILEGIRTLHNVNQELFGEEFGYNGIEVTHHQNSALDHIDTVDGKQFALIDKIQEQINNGIETEIKQEDIRGNQVRVKGKIYDDYNAMNNALLRKVSTLNCRHRTFAIIVGVSKPEYTQEQLDEDKKKNIDGFEFEGKHYSMYDGEQLLRKIELELRKSKDTQIMGRASGNKQIVEESQTRITQLTSKYRDVLKVSGLPSKLSRARVQNYHRVNVDKMK